MFRHLVKEATVRIGDRMLRAVVVGVSLSMVGTAMLIFDFVVGREAGVLAAVAVAVVVLALGFLVPLVVRNTVSKLESENPRKG
jgi:hypothetical protein